MTAQITKLLVTAVVCLSVSACSNTMRGVKQDTERATEKTAAGLETADVKSALVADGRVDATNINVDTIASTKTVVLKGSVPTIEQKATAETIAREQAKGYTITNQLTVAPK
jgi:osmotically-inducible protein OsmY